MSVTCSLQSPSSNDYQKQSTLWFCCFSESNILYQGLHSLCFSISQYTNHLGKPIYSEFFLNLPFGFLHGKNYKDIKTQLGKLFTPLSWLFLPLPHARPTVWCLPLLFFTQTSNVHLNTAAMTNSNPRGQSDRCFLLSFFQSNSHIHTWPLEKP